MSLHVLHPFQLQAQIEKYFPGGGGSRNDLLPGVLGLGVRELFFNFCIFYVK